MLETLQDQTIEKELDQELQAIQSEALIEVVLPLPKLESVETTRKQLVEYFKGDGSIIAKIHSYRQLTVDKLLYYLNPELATEFKDEMFGLGEESIGLSVNEIKFKFYEIFDRFDALKGK